MGELKLTAKQELFAQNYIKTGNASEAFRLSYDAKNMTTKSIWEKSCVLLKNVKVAERVNELQQELNKKHDLSKERILEELDCIMNANIKDYVHWDGEELKFKPFDLLTDEQSRAIESIKMGRNGLELKLHGKSWTIERICKMLGYDAPVKVDNSVKFIEVDDGTSEEIG